MVGSLCCGRMSGGSSYATLLFENISSHGSIKDGMLTFFAQVVSPHFKTFATGDIIAEAGTETLRFT